MTLSASDFIPPAFPKPDATPGLLAALRSVRCPVHAWPSAVFDGGLHRAPFPGGPLVISDPALAEELLVEKADDFPRGERINRLFRPVWGGGVFVAEAADWRWQRRAASPAFRPAHVTRLVPIMRAAAERTLADWARAGPIDLQQQMRRLTLNVLLDAALSGGEDFSDREEAGRRIEAFITAVGRFAVTDFLPMPDRWRPSTSARGGRAAARLRAAVERMVERRRRANGASGDLPDLLLAARDPETGRGMDDRLVRDNLIGFIAAGHETSAHALAWSLWLIACHPLTERRVLAEIEAAAGREPVGPEALERLVFTRKVVQEAMRLFPGAMALARTAARDTSIGGRPVRRGQLVLVATYALHRRADIWPNPHAWDPDRFAARLQAARPAFAYLPFGAGPRVCMGAAFAMTEIVTVLATLVRGVRLTPDLSKAVRLTGRMGATVAEHGLWASPALRRT